MKSTRRGILIVGRTGLLGLAGSAFLVASHSGDDVFTGEAKKQKGKHSSNGKGHKKNRGNKNPPRHHGKNNRGKQKGNQKGIRLETGSLLPERLIAEEAGRFAAHMLLPFEEFSSEAELAEAVAEAEKLNLFILPEATEPGTASPEP